VRLTQAFAPRRLTAHPGEWCILSLQSTTLPNSNKIYQKNFL
jgi:hypothetical protein